MSLGNIYKSKITYCLMELFKKSSKKKRVPKYFLRKRYSSFLIAGFVFMIFSILFSSATFTGSSILNLGSPNISVGILFLLGGLVFVFLYFFIKNN